MQQLEDMKSELLVSNSVRVAELERSLEKMVRWVTLAAVAIPVGQALPEKDHDRMLLELEQAKSRLKNAR